MFGSRITKGKRVKIRSISAFKPNTPILQHSYTLHGGITQIATDIPITNSLDSHPRQTQYSSTPGHLVSKIPLMTQLIWLKNNAVHGIIISLGFVIKILCKFQDVNQIFLGDLE